VFKKASELVVGDVVVGQTGTARVEAVTYNGRNVTIAYAKDRTLEYVDDRATFIRDEMDPLLRVDSGTTPVLD
jgi:hypothetical protein